MEDEKSWRVLTVSMGYTYSSVSYLDINSFFNSLKSQGSLGESWMAEARERFAKWLGGE